MASVVIPSTAVVITYNCIPFALSIIWWGRRRRFMLYIEILGFRAYEQDNDTLNG